MSRLKVMIAATLFIAATCVKFMLPTVSAQLYDRLDAAMEQETDFRSIAVSIGNRLSSESIISVFNTRRHAAEEPSPLPVLSAMPGQATISLPDTLPEIRAENAAVYGRAPSPEAVALWASPPAAQEVTASTEELPASEPEPAAQANTPVETFLAQQSAYSGYVLPANVSYEMPTISIPFVSPLYGFTSSGFGYRVHPISGDVKFHYGTDFAAWTGTDICCFADGVVSVAGEDNGYGKYLIIEHRDGLRSLYAHCSELLAVCGESVSAGQVIAKVGSTGLATGPHLHFELQKDGVYLNPEYYVNFTA